MTSKTERTTKTNLFDEDITSVYDFDLPQSRYDRYDMEVEIFTSDEQYMVDALHQQYVAIEGRAAIAQLIDSKIGEVATHSAYVMGTTMENTARIEAATPMSRLTKMQQGFDNQLLAQTGKYMLETNAVAYRTMLEDARRNIYKPPPEPEKPRWKGLIPLVIEFFIGEQ